MPIRVTNGASGEIIVARGQIPRPPLYGVDAQSTQTFPQVALSRCLQYTVSQVYYCPYKRTQNKRPVFKHIHFQRGIFFRWTGKHRQPAKASATSHRLPFEALKRYPVCQYLRLRPSNKNRTYLKGRCLRDIYQHPREGGNK